MFDHESCYVGYQILYGGDRYYVFDDDENNITIYKMIINDPNLIGIYNEHIKYSFDFNNPLVIDKHHSYYQIYDTFLNISRKRINDLKQTTLSGDYNQNKKHNINNDFELGDVLTLNKSNHKIVYLWKDNGVIYYVQLRGGFLVNRVCIIKEGKIKRKCDRLTNEERKQLLIDLQNNCELSDNDNYYIDKDEVKEKIDSCLKKAL